MSRQPRRKLPPPPEPPPEPPTPEPDWPTTLEPGSIWSGVSTQSVWNLRGDAFCLRGSGIRCGRLNNR